MSSYLTLVVTAVCAHLFFLLVLRNKPLLFYGCSVYRYSQGTVVFCAVGMSVSLLLFASIGAPMSHPLGTNLYLAAFTALAVLTCHYLHRFRVVMNAGYIQTVAFGSRRMEFADVVRVVYAHGGRGGGTVHVCGNTGKRIKFGAGISDFRLCLGELKSRLPVGVTIED